MWEVAGRVSSELGKGYEEAGEHQNPRALKKNRTHSINTVSCTMLFSALLGSGIEITSSLLIFHPMHPTTGEHDQGISSTTSVKFCICNHCNAGSNI